ncbi:hypothetical protein WL27_18040 [Burkholderia multivorans]|uniref:glycosyltransferase family 4 protein n=1 Tax=Burkholderia multivorans TaxID=87883 RepID=UPI00075921D7|nr:glycosyltransferase family 4 protein [Burkholderia multivorans]KWA36768.1 hypothetical protein WL27_18040 [Burkholderia multivorans]
MKISYVNGICVRNDAISNDVRDEIRAFRAAGINDIRLFSYRCDYDDLASKCVSEPRDVAFDSHFLESDVIVFHFGIFYPLFDLLALAPVRARKLVVFHNVTPKELVKRKDRDVIEKSFAQITNIAWADHVICKSELNLEVLRDAGVRTPATILPLAIHAPAPPPDSKPSFTDDVVRVAFVGRFVKPKGPEELLAALKHVRLPNEHCRVRVDLVGNTAFSDPEVLRNVRDAVAALNGDPAARIAAEIHGDVDDASKNSILRSADVFVLPTYHEGFGVPIVEAIAAGCHVVAYDNSNTPSVAGGLGTLVPTGNVEALSDALSDVLANAVSSEWRDGGSQGYSGYVARARAHAGKFAPEKVARDFVELVTRLVN